MTAQSPSLRDVGARVESLLVDLSEAADPKAAAAGDALVRALMELYGAGLERIVELTAGESGATLAELAADPHIACLLVLHDLHPVPLDERLDAALEQVRPYLGSHAGGVDLLGVDDAGVAHIKLQGSCDGCDSSTITVKYAIEKALLDAAPELTGVEAEGLPEAAPAPASVNGLHQIGSGPPGAEPVQPSGEDWIHLSDVQLLPGQTMIVDAAGATVLICSVEGSLYAYRNACPACAASLGGATLGGRLLACDCGHVYDVVLAGRNDVEGTHLDPLPLLPASGGFKIAVPRTLAGSAGP